MFKRLLIPIDGRPPSQNAIGEGLVLAKQLGADVTFLHAFQKPAVTWTELAAYEPQLSQGLRRAGGGYLARARERADLAGVHAVVRLVEDTHPARAILDEAPMHDLIVLGTHGRRGFDRWMFGSIAEAVMRRTTTPCLLVREDRAVLPTTVDEPDEGESEPNADRAMLSAASGTSSSTPTSAGDEKVRGDIR